MKIIKPSFEILEQSNGIERMFDHIELCSRTCYKSERKSDISSEEFVNKLIKAGHTAMLEHGTITFYVPIDKIPYRLFDGYTHIYTREGGKAKVVTNYRALYENNLTELIDLMSNHENDRITVKFICNRAIANEFVRHRKFSFAQESTRYCNYSRDKFNNEISFILPDIEDKYNEIIKENLENVEKLYRILTKEGVPAQFARDILPLCTKTELVMTGFIEDWKYFLDIRSTGITGTPHPAAKFLADGVFKEFQRRQYLDNRVPNFKETY